MFPSLKYSVCCHWFGYFPSGNSTNRSERRRRCWLRCVHSPTRFDDRSICCDHHSVRPSTEIPEGHLPWHRCNGSHVPPPLHSHTEQGVSLNRTSWLVFFIKSYWFLFGFIWFYQTLRIERVSTVFRCSALIIFPSLNGIGASPLRIYDSIRYETW